MAPSVASTAVPNWQGSLLGGGRPSLDPDFGGLERIPLDHGAWVDLCHGWLKGPDTLFEVLSTTLPWTAPEMVMYDHSIVQPRLSAWWRPDRDHPWPEGVLPLARALESRYGVPFENFGANLYRDGRDSVAWHGDRLHRDQNRALVAVITLGAPRTFLLRPRGGGPSVRLRPAAGDLLVMGGTCQRTWQHSVPKTARPVGPRISVTLRPHPGTPIPALGRPGSEPRGASFRRTGRPGVVHGSRSAGLSGTSTANSRSHSSGTSSSTAALVEARTTGAATPSR